MEMGSNADDTLYGVLDVTANATFEEIESAYERLMAYLAVDSMALYSMGVDPDEIVEQRARVEEAFRVLSDPQLRAAYDDARRGGDDYPSIMLPDSQSDGGTSMSVGRFDDDFHGDYDDGFEDDGAAFTEEVLPALHKERNPNRDVEPAVDKAIPPVESPPDEPAPRITEPLAPATAAADVPVSTPPVELEVLGGDTPVLARAEPVPAALSRQPSDSIDPSPLPRVEPAPLPRSERISLPKTEQATPPFKAEPAPLPRMARPTPPRGEPPPPKILPTGARSRPSPARRCLHPTIEPSALAADTEIGGGLLKRLRESCDATLEEVATITKINKRYLRAIEENDYGVLPAKVYVRGFVFEYARILGLDPQVVAKGYLRLYERHCAEGED